MKKRKQAIALARSKAPPELKKIRKVTPWYAKAVTMFCIVSGTLKVIHYNVGIDIGRLALPLQLILMIHPLAVFFLLICLAVRWLFPSVLMHASLKSRGAQFAVFLSLMTGTLVCEKYLSMG